MSTSSTTLAPAASPESRNAAPLVVCTPWCEDGDGHPNRASAEEQTCYQPQVDVPLSRSQVDHWLGDHVARVYAVREFDYHVSVELGRGDLAGLTFSPAEARQVAAELMRSADLADEALARGYRDGLEQGRQASA